MKSTPKWLLIPPAVAVLLILGPLSMQGTKDTADPSTTQPVQQPAATKAATPAATKAATDGKAPGSLVPRTPDMWKMTSALVGVLLLGVGGVFVLRKLRGGATPSGGAALATLRQTVRLSQRQALHAIEFDDRILLVGEHERGLVLIDRGRLPETASDEAEVLARHQAPAAVEEEGAVPKNLLIPRPDPAPRPVAPTQPSITPAAVAATRGTQLNQFRNLLQKAGR